MTDILADQDKTQYETEQFRLQPKYLKLKESIKQAFLSKTLAKGYSEVLKCIALFKNLEIFIPGKLDENHEKKFEDTLLKIENPYTKVHYLPLTYRRIVYDAIREVPNPKKKSSEKPKKYFNTRLFAIIKEGKEDVSTGRHSDSDLPINVEKLQDDQRSQS